MKAQGKTAKRLYFQGCLLWRITQKHFVFSAVVPNVEAVIFYSHADRQGEEAEQIADTEANLPLNSLGFSPLAEGLPFMLFI